MLAELSAAAARGVDVVIFTNAGETPKLRYKWSFIERRDHAVGRFKAAGYELVVFDYDGDSSDWELRRSKEVVAKGEHWGGGEYYHFDRCLLDAEAALQAEVRRRLSPPPPSQ